jgi:glutathione-specific gamma-glutamylcyclotransferase
MRQGEAGLAVDICGKHSLGYRDCMGRTMQQFWVFGYGSLMWKPGFSYIDTAPAQIFGYHRSLCVYSYVHRGTPEQPGLVMGLDWGGSCHGVAYRIDPKQWPETLSYLRSREQVTMVYREIAKPIKLLRGGHLLVQATVYVVDRSHKQYAGRLSIEEQLRFIRQGFGQSGICSEYVLNTAQHLVDMQIHDRTLKTLAKELKAKFA